MDIPSGGGPAAGWVLPFVFMLLAIAICPLAVHHWWERNRNKLLASLLLGAPVLVYYLSFNPHLLWETGLEYLSFMLLLASLYIVSGGILLRADLRATPLVNTTFLACGTVLASLIGTTGASLLLIRPLLRTNRERRHTAHTVVFFVFLVSNIGGALTPLGDPPLFVGYLEGVPFTWTLGLWPEWLSLSGALLLIYFVWDALQFGREPIAALQWDRLWIEPLRVGGLVNLPLLLLIIVAVALLPPPWREGAMAAAALLSLWWTPAELRRANHFTSYPILEVAALFFGIFLTMIPALELLRARGGALGISTPQQFFWATGILSAFLDNTPTYLAFLNLARGMELAPVVAGVSHATLRAISLGAVFMGATTYIGNAPNFMVRSIAAAQGIRMPSFFLYMVYSATILIPLFVGLALGFL